MKQTPLQYVYEEIIILEGLKLTSDQYARKAYQEGIDSLNRVKYQLIKENR